MLKKIKNLEEIVNDKNLTIEQKQEELNKYICPYIDYNGSNITCSYDGYCYHKLNNYICNAKSMVSMYIR
jgi:hypothetical protein